MLDRPPVLMLIDGPSIVYRAYFAMMQTPLTTSAGMLVTGIFGFFNIVLRGMQDLKPDYADCQLRPRPAGIPFRGIPGLQGRSSIDA